MLEQLQSIIIGTAGLTVAAVVSMWLSLSRNTIAADRLSTVRWLVYAGIVLHICHVTEESLTGFFTALPQLLNLVPWSLTFFIAFNLAWILIWLLCIPFLTAYPRAALFPVWFLAIASAANAIVHPLLSVISGGYFPGLWSSPLLGILGVVLLRALVSATRRGTMSDGAS